MCIVLVSCELVILFCAILGNLMTVISTDLLRAVKFIYFNAVFATASTFYQYRTFIAEEKCCLADCSQCYSCM